MTQWGILYNILIKYAIPMKLARLIQKYLNEIYIKVHTGKNAWFIFYWE
jgi:hypothetical protein